MASKITVSSGYICNACKRKHFIFFLIQIPYNFVTTLTHYVKTVLSDLVNHIMENSLALLWLEKRDAGSESSNLWLLN
jgi:hypothetical protein